MVELCDKNYCTGCAACLNACTNNAITMTEDNRFGHLYPQINKENCIKCNKCIKVCPEINKVKLNKPLKYLAAMSKTKNILNTCSSGGIASLLSLLFYNNQGNVYGAVFDENCQLNHTLLNNKKLLKKARGSKYVQSQIGSVYQQINKDLKTQKKVLFIGTPCQVSGLKCYLNKDFDNLFTIDLICHGVPSQKLLNMQISEIYPDKNINNVVFRKKDNGEFFSFALYNNNNKVYEQDWTINPYFFTFMVGGSFRESCYNCRYGSGSRIGDITLGDYWGINQNNLLYKNKNEGISNFLINTKKGEKLLSEISDQIVIEKISEEDSKRRNPQLEYSFPRSEKVDKLNYHLNRTMKLTKAYRITYYRHVIKMMVLKWKKLVF